MNKYVSGFCSSKKGCWNTAPHGAPYRCKGEYAGAECTCDCHDPTKTKWTIEAYDPPVNPDTQKFTIPRPVLPPPPVIARPPRRDNETLPLPVVPPDRQVRKFKPTPSGRSSRGELEQQVKQVCDEWITGVIEVGPDGLTVRAIAERIQDRIKSTTRPSGGAINSVLIRWENIGFAITTKKPNGFADYTEEGRYLGLQTMKDASDAGYKS